MEVLYLNTSHVKVKRTNAQTEDMGEANLNTSHVKVKPFVVNHIWTIHFYLNTSHVKVKREAWKAIAKTS